MAEAGVGSGEWGVGEEWGVGGRESRLSIVCSCASLRIISKSFIVSLPIPHSPFPTPHSPLPTPHSPLPTPHSPFPSSSPLSLRPLVALNENLAVCRHARFGETEAGFQLQLDPDDLFHALVTEVCVLRREGGFGIYA